MKLEFITLSFFLSAQVCLTHRRGIARLVYQQDLLGSLKCWEVWYGIVVFNVPLDTL